jgi:tetratricopeptide (TPR) repeat protein
MRLGRPDEAASVLEECVELLREEPVDDHTEQRDLAQTLDLYGQALSKNGNHAEALSATEEAVSIEKAYADERKVYTPQYAHAMCTFADVRLVARQQQSDAIEMLKLATPILIKLGEHDPEAYAQDIWVSMNMYAEALKQLGRTDEERRYRQMLDDLAQEAQRLQDTGEDTKGSGQAVAD